MSRGGGLSFASGPWHILPLAYMPFDRDRMQERTASLAVQGVYLGTSSWKYEGWMGQLYNAERYEYRGKVAKSRFERDCLREYAEVFKSVCVDAAYYTFPSQQYLERMVEQVPQSLMATAGTDKPTPRWSQ